MSGIQSVPEKNHYMKILGAKQVVIIYCNIIIQNYLPQKLSKPFKNLELSVKSLVRAERESRQINRFGIGEDLNRELTPYEMRSMQVMFLK